ncbi:MAG: OPT/YSL family transporter [Phycisphaerales bacterium]|nr:OPT/YSL family transporter [Phycisphaerales bacterium]
MAGPSGSSESVKVDSSAGLFGPGVPALPANATAEEKDAHWFKHVYQGDKMPQLTLRAVLMGGVLGMLMSAANLYTTLSIGWAFGIAITACVLSFVIWNVVVLMGRGKVNQMSVLENACMASCASAAGYSTGSTIATMFGALVLLKEVPEGVSLRSISTADVTPPWVVVVFTLCTGLMGVFLAIPMKRQQINHEQLPFPSGIAAAETLRSLYSKSAEALHKAYMLVAGLGLGMVVGVLRASDEVIEAVGVLRWFFHNLPFLRIPEYIKLQVFNKLYPDGRYPVGFAFEPSALLIAAGMIVGMRTSVSLVVSSLLLYGVVGPKMAEIDAAHLAEGGNAVAAQVRAMEKDERVVQLEPREIGARLIEMIREPVQKLNLPEPTTAGVMKAAQNGLNGALDEIEGKLAKKKLEAMVEEAEKLGLDGWPIKREALRMQRAAADGVEKARTEGALVEAVRLARAAKVDPNLIVRAVKSAEDQAAVSADLKAGRVVVSAIINAAKTVPNADVKKIEDAAASRLKSGGANPGRESAKVAGEVAVKHVEEELCADPSAVQAAMKSAFSQANAEASGEIAAAAIRAVNDEALKLKLDVQAITRAGESAAVAAEKGEWAAMLSAAESTLRASASAIGKDATGAIEKATSVKFDGDEAKENAKTVRERIGTAAGASAANAWANRDAVKAREEAERTAREAGKPYCQVKQSGEAAYDGARFTPNLNWNWGGGEITLTRWSLWGGTALMVFASLTSVGLQWRTFVRAFSGRKAESNVHETAEMHSIEVPGWWMAAGMIPITIAMVWLQIQAFQVAWYAGVIAVAMSFVLSLVASRATGETDTTPIGAMGKVMQLTFAALAPKNVAANLASAGIAANSASSCADLLTDLKTGYLLGANPRKQFLAQFFGVFFGTIAIVPIWYLMVPTREALERYALPSTRAWEAVARVLVKGISELPQSAIIAIFLGATIGVVLPLTERLVSPKVRAWLPSATGMGLAWVMPFQNAFSFFVGAVIAMIWVKISKKNNEKYNVPIASGLIAGESLMAAALAILGTVMGLVLIWMSQQY